MGYNLDCVLVLCIPFLHLFKVLAQPTVEKQGEELRQWFKAFKNQDYSKRDYRKYFKVCDYDRIVKWLGSDRRLEGLVPVCCVESRS